MPHFSAVASIVVFFGIGECVFFSAAVQITFGFFFCFKQTPYKYSHIFAQYNLFGCDTYSGLFQYPLKVVKKNKINKFIRSSVLDAMFCFLYFAILHFVLYA